MLSLKLAILVFTFVLFEHVTNAQNSNSTTAVSNCNPNPCLNQATCINTEFGHKCVCQPPFYGKKCQNKICQTIKCLNGGSCDPSSEIDSCLCLSFFNGTQCENGPFCPDNYCENNGTCVIKSDSNKPTCNCPSSFIGDKCEIEMPQNFWTLDEQCKANFGEDFSADSLYSSYQFWKSYDPQILNYLWKDACQVGTCYFKKDFYLSIQPVDGTICGPNRVCAEGKCLKAQNVPNDLKDGNIVDDLDCRLYLEWNIEYAPYLCQDPWFNSKCSISCQFFTEFKDKDPLCPFYSGLCQSGYIPGSNVAVSQLCPSTCAIGKNLTCPVDGGNAFCLNGGTCVDVNYKNPKGFIKFRCECPTGYYGILCQNFNPCKANTCQENFACQPISRYNYGCFSKANHDGQGA